MPKKGRKKRTNVGRDITRAGNIQYQADRGQQRTSTPRGRSSTLTLARPAGVNFAQQAQEQVVADLRRRSMEQFYEDRAYQSQEGERRRQRALEDIQHQERLVRAEERDEAREIHDANVLAQRRRAHEETLDEQRRKRMAQEHGRARQDRLIQDGLGSMRGAFAEAQASGERRHGELMDLARQGLRELGQRTNRDPDDIDITFMSETGGGMDLERDITPIQEGRGGLTPARDTEQEAIDITTPRPKREPEPEPEPLLQEATSEEELGREPTESESWFSGVVKATEKAGKVVEGLGKYVDPITQLATQLAGEFTPTTTTTQTTPLSVKQREKLKKEQEAELEASADEYLAGHDKPKHEWTKEQLTKIESFKSKLHTIGSPVSHKIEPEPEPKSPTADVVEELTEGDYGVSEKVGEEVLSIREQTPVIGKTFYPDTHKHLSERFAEGDAGDFHPDKFKTLSDKRKKVVADNLYDVLVEDDDFEAWIRHATFWDFEKNSDAHLPDFTHGDDGFNREHIDEIWDSEGYDDADHLRSVWDANDKIIDDYNKGVSPTENDLTHDELRENFRDLLEHNIEDFSISHDPSDMAVREGGTQQISFKGKGLWKPSWARHYTNWATPPLNDVVDVDIKVFDKGVWDEEYEDLIDEEEDEETLEILRRDRINENLDPENYDSEALLSLMKAHGSYSQPLEEERERRERQEQPQPEPEPEITLGEEPTKGAKVWGEGTATTSEESSLASSDSDTSSLGSLEGLTKDTSLADEHISKQGDVSKLFQQQEVGISTMIDRPKEEQGKGGTGYRPIPHLTRTGSKTSQGSPRDTTQEERWGEIEVADTEPGFTLGESFTEIEEWEGGDPPPAGLAQGVLEGIGVAGKLVGEGIGTGLKTGAGVVATGLGDVATGVAEAGYDATLGQLPTAEAVKDVAYSATLGKLPTAKEAGKAGAEAVGGAVVSGLTFAGGAFAGVVGAGVEAVAEQVGLGQVSDLSEEYIAIRDDPPQRFTSGNANIGFTPTNIIITDRRGVINVRSQEELKAPGKNKGRKFYLMKVDATHFSLVPTDRDDLTGWTNISRSRFDALLTQGKIDFEGGDF